MLMAVVPIVSQTNPAQKKKVCHHLSLFLIRSAQTPMVYSTIARFINTMAKIRVVPIDLRG
jgi:hypothetical protein